MIITENMDFYILSECGFTGAKRKMRSLENFVRMRIIEAKNGGMGGVFTLYQI